MLQASPQSTRDPLPKMVILSSSSSSSSSTSSSADESTSSDVGEESDEDQTVKQVSGKVQNRFSHSPAKDEVPMSSLERLIRTHPIWFLPTVNREESEEILQGKEEGVRHDFFCWIVDTVYTTYGNKYQRAMLRYVANIFNSPAHSIT